MDFCESVDSIEELEGNFGMVPHVYQAWFLVQLVPARNFQELDGLKQDPDPKLKEKPLSA